MVNILIFYVLELLELVDWELDAFYSSVKSMVAIQASHPGS